MSRFQAAILKTLISASALTLFSVLAFADSQVRIVRLSDVQGSVQVNRSDSYGRAFLNLPIVEGNKVRTLIEGRAQIEFEDGSVLRLAPNTVVEFPKLSLSDAGVKISSVRIKSGVAYVNLVGAKDSQLVVTFGNHKIVMDRPAHLRIQVSDTSAEIAVFRGDVQIESPAGTIDVSKNRTAAFDLDQDQGKLAKNIEPGLYDEWDKEQDQYQKRYAAASVTNVSPYSYGLADLNYYGNYFNQPGYGLMWQPYFAGASWNPFLDGAWALYPGVGYAWVSSYPWGWTPYHSGSWTFISGRGWAWQPGGGWTAIGTNPRVVNPPMGFASPRPPATTGQSLIVVSRPAALGFAGRSTSKVIIRDNSAGLGVPRGAVNNLATFSHRASTEGFATARIHTTPIRTPMTQSSNWPSPGSNTSTGSLPRPSGAMHPAATGSAPAHTSSPSSGSPGRGAPSRH